MMTSRMIQPSKVRLAEKGLLVLIVLGALGFVAYKNTMSAITDAVNSIGKDITSKKV